MTDNSMIETQVQQRLVKERAALLYEEAGRDPDKILNAASAVLGECSEIEHKGRILAPSQPEIRGSLLESFKDDPFNQSRFGILFCRAVQTRIERACIEQAMQEADPCG